MDTEASKALNDLAPQALESIKDYFTTGSDNANGRANMALKVLSRINGNDANRLKLLSLQFAIARHSGMKGPELRPLLAELAPALGPAQLQEGESKERAELKDETQG